MHSRRIDPITRSMWARCQGERGAESTSSMPGSRTSLVKPAPKMPSRPRRRCRGTCSNGKASRSCCPVHSAVGLRGDVEMHDPPAVVSQHQEHVQHLKANGRHREEVDRNRGLHVVFQEGAPCLRRRIPTAGHVFAHAGFADVNAQFEEFSVDARSAPKRVLAAHLPNQLTDFLRHRRAAALAAANLPSPKQSKSLAVPSDDGLRRRRPGEKADEVLTDSYTGIGEVVGVHQTGLLLARLNRPIQVKRARLLSLDDVQDRDVIFIGGTAENLDLRKILPASAIRIYNEGTTPAAAAAAPGGIQQLDEPINAYTVVTLTHGVRPQHWTPVLADSSTLGTQAAVE